MSAAIDYLPKEFPRGRKLCQILYELVQSLAPDARVLLLNELSRRINGNGNGDGQSEDPQMSMLADAWAVYFEVLPPAERDWLLRRLRQSISAT